VLEDAFKGALRCFRSKLSNRAARRVPARFLSVKTATFSDVIEPLRSTGTVLSAVDVAGAPGSRGCIVIQGSVISGMLAVFLGETPENAALSADARPSTQLDLKIATRLVQDFVASVAEGASRPEIGMVSYPVGPLGISGSAMKPGSVVLEITVEIGLVDAPLGILTLMLPTEVASKLAPRIRARPTRQDDLERVLPVNLAVVAELGRIQTTLRAIKDLKPGAMLDLGQTPRVDVRVGGKLALSGEPGVADGKRCVRVGTRYT